MSNVAKEVDYNLTAETVKDKDGDGLRRVPHGDLSSVHAMHESPDRGSIVDEQTNLASMKIMHEGLDDLCRAPHDDLSIRTAVGEVHGIGINSPSSASVHETHVQPSAESIPSHVASHKYVTSPALHNMVEQQYEGLSSHTVSEAYASLAANGKFSKHSGENTVASGVSCGRVDGAAPHDSSSELSPTSDCDSREEFLKGNAHATAKVDTLHSDVADGCMPESPTAYGFLGWHACQNGVGPNSHVASMHVGKIPDETLPGNDSVGNYAGERPTHHSPFSGLSPTQPTLVGANGGLEGFTCKETSANCDMRGTVLNYRKSNDEVGTYVHGKFFGYNEPIVEDLQVNIENPASGNQDPSITTKNGSVFSGSLYYKSQSGYMQNVAHLLRFGAAIFSLIAFSVMISNSEKRVAAGSTFYVRFSDFQAYNYLAALNLLTFLYSSGQLVLHAQARTGRILSSPVKWGASVYLCDQMLAFLMISSSSSAATASELSRHGLHSIWPPACSTWKLSLFCSRADVAVAMSFASCFFMFLSTFSSGYHLSNLLAE